MRDLSSKEGNYCQEESVALSLSDGLRRQMDYPLFFLSFFFFSLIQDHGFHHPLHSKVLQILTLSSYCTTDVMEIFSSPFGPLVYGVQSSLVADMVESSVGLLLCPTASLSPLKSQNLLNCRAQRCRNEKQNFPMW